MKSSTTHSKSGQALAELIVGVVAVMVLFALILQLGHLSRARTETLLEARADAGRDAMNPVYQFPLTGPQSIRDWSPGGDESRYSEDDEELLTGGDMLNDEILSVLPDGSLTTYIPMTHPIQDVYQSGLPQDAWQLVHDRESSDDVEILPVLRHLIYDADSISLEKEVWMTWLGGLDP